MGQMRAGQGNYGFDAASGRYVDLAEAGIIDPTKVVRVAPENAVSVASVLPAGESHALPEGDASTWRVVVEWRRGNHVGANVLH